MLCELGKITLNFRDLHIYKWDIMVSRKIEVKVKWEYMGPPHRGAEPELRPTAHH